MTFFQYLKNKLLYFSMASFIFVASFAFSSSSFAKSLNREIVYEPRYDLSPIPTLKGKVSFPVLSAWGVYAIDLDSRISLFEKNSDIAFFPASTTKIMTALVAIENYSTGERVRINGEYIPGQKMGLIAGEEIAVRDLLDGLLIFSGNDAAEALANHFPNGRDGFVYEMNRRAKALGLKNTYFSNPSGLDEVNHFSTARDLVTLTEFALDNPIFSEIVSTESKTVTSIDGTVVHRLTNLNELLGEVDGVLGVKTGWTENARENLVTYVNRDGRRVLISLMGSQDRFGETRELIEFIFENYKWVYPSAPASISP